VSALPRRTLGRTGLSVSALGFGAMELRGLGHNRGRALADGQAERVLHAVLDAGIDFVDTSPDYGESEAEIGRWIAHRRDEFVLASKCGCPLDPPPEAPRPLPHDYSRANIVAVVDQSLRRMRTDHLDVLQFHISPAREVLEREDAIATLLDLRDQGKVRFLGSSSTLPELADHVAMGVFDELQVPYSALQREHEEWIARAAAAGIGVVVRGGVAKGEPGVGLGAAEAWARWDAAGLDDLLDGESRTAFLLRFTISHPGVATTIVGTLDVGHLEQNVATAARGPLPPDVHAEARRRLDAAATPTST
jgi:aryl-alcohol dehydrogenase-like predicted oxidoreductase